MSSDAMASRVRQLIGIPSMTWVPEVETTSPGTCSRRMAPAITERAALPVHNVTTWRSGIGGTLLMRLRPSALDLDTTPVDHPALIDAATSDGPPSRCRCDANLRAVALRLDGICA